MTTITFSGGTVGGNPSKFSGGDICYVIQYLGGGFKYFLFSPLPGEMIQFD